MFPLVKRFPSQSAKRNEIKSFTGTILKAGKRPIAVIINSENA